MSRSVSVYLYRQKGDLQPLHKIEEGRLDNTPPSIGVYKQRIIAEAIQLGRIKPEEAGSVHVEMYENRT
ncbi:hypothetical protein [Ochrobactrum sp. MC-1LL]|uniref:hypothetical protein n=1 Tax=Ochrobactrum sp. MC-1LL TaxID=2735351 RepID=UPI0014385A09|nr:hypothetical protein [Ochrobactrum sp. MC-1LL]NKE75036.1 hypothetical protein [Ochrobactrum sp. MC-1LL]